MKKSRHVLILKLLTIMSMTFLAGCSNQTVEEDTMNKNELITEILEINPYLNREELLEENQEALENKLKKLKEKKDAKEEDFKQRELEKEELDEDEMNLDENRQEDNPNPPEPPIYEKPQPVPNPPIEDK